MISTIIKSILCFAIAIIAFTPNLRNIKFYRALSFYFLFEGFHSILSYIFSNIWGNYSIIFIIHNIGVIIFGMYLLFSMFYNYHKKK